MKKKLLILLSFLSVLICSNICYSITMDYRGVFLGERIPEYYLVQFDYDYTKLAIDYYTAKKSECEGDITRIAVYQNKLMSVDIINSTSKYRLFFISTMSVLNDEYGKFKYMNAVSKDISEFIWVPDQDNQIVLSIDTTSESATLTFLNKTLFKQYLKEITIL